MRIIRTLLQLVKHGRSAVYLYGYVFQFNFVDAPMSIHIHKI